jgi:antirestriction protein ArdC
MATATKKKSKGKSTQQIHDEVTNRIIASLEEGTVPWQRPWKVIGGLHSNWKSQKHYRGINQFLLDLTAQVAGYRSPYWLTYKQAGEESLRIFLKECREAGEKDVPTFADASAKNGRKPATELAATWQSRHREEGWKGVKEGEKTTFVTFTKRIPLKDKVTKEPVLDEKGKQKFVYLLRYYNVVNAEQTGLDLPNPKEQDLRDHTPIEAAQRIIDGCPNRPEISHHGDRAYYMPSADSITLPTPEQFESDEAYYGTAFHELVHATGHESRTGRVKDWTLFGSDPYAKEELVAEIGSAILAGHSGIENESLHENTAAYIQNWIKRFKDDHTLLIGAGSKAQGAVDYILDTKFDNNNNKDKEQ